MFFMDYYIIGKIDPMGYISPLPYSLPPEEPHEDEQGMMPHARNPPRSPAQHGES